MCELETLRAKRDRLAVEAELLRAEMGKVNLELWAVKEKIVEIEVMFAS